MEKFGRSQPVKRVEDLRFLTGQGKYIGDTVPEGALVAYVLRSPVAHATITAIGLEEARAVEGVQLVLDGDALEEAGLSYSLPGSVVPNRDGTRGAKPKRPLLARGRLRHVGEPVVLIVAETMTAAKDAAELVELDYEDLPVHLELAPGGETIHPEAPDNRAFDFGLGDEEGTEKALAGSARVVRLSIADNRVIPNSMEPRGCTASWEDGRLHVAISGQGVWGTKSKLVRAFGLEDAQVRVTTPDVGGGFGTKGMDYPETFLCAHAAKVTGRPVHWMSDRTEAMLSDNAGRDLVSDVEMGFDADNRITAYRIRTRCNLGAYNSQFGQPIQSELFSKVAMGTYDIPNGWLQVEGFYTNTTQVDAYRGAGRPEAIYVLERTIDFAARELGVDPWDLRRKNFIAAAQFPYTTAMGVTYDIGDFHKVLESARSKAALADWPARREASAAKGLLRGIGLSYYIESILGDPEESAKIELTAGGARIYVGTQSNGQGHETVYAQYLSDISGIPAEQIQVVQGDSDLIPMGGGTGGSRSVTVQNTATLAATEQMTAAFTAFLADTFDLPEADITFDEGAFRLGGSNKVYTMLEAADLAREHGRDDLLVHEAKIKLDARSFPNGAHVAEVEIDPETGLVHVDRYTVVDDFGNLVNPMLVEGQVHGGIAQGLGQAVTEHVVFDGDGQLLTATFMDYAMPRAVDMPPVSFSTEPVPTKTNPLGMKGCGEAGTVGALAAISNAVLDALWAEGVRQVDMPFTPQRVWSMLNDAARAAQ